MSTTPERDPDAPEAYGDDTNDPPETYPDKPVQDDGTDAEPDKDRADGGG